MMMKRGSFILIHFLLLSLFISGCDTRRHIYQDGWATIKVAINWELLALATKNDDTAPNGATIAIFPVSGYLEDPIFKQTNFSTCEIALPVGVYNIVVFNETINGHDYIEFTGTNSYDTFEAHWERTSVDEEYSRNDNDNMVTNTDDFLLVERMEGFEVTYDMLEYESAPQLNFTPEVVNRVMNVLVHIQGVVNVASNSYSMLYIDGMASGYSMGSGVPTQSKAIHLMSLGDRSYYDGSESDGTMSASFYTFGDAASETRSDDDNVATMSFALRNETLHPDIEVNFSDQMDDSDSVSEINVVIGEDGSIVLPDVSDMEQGNGGITADVGGWGDQIIVDLDR